MLTQLINAKLRKVQEFRVTSLHSLHKILLHETSSESQICIVYKNSFARIESDFTFSDGLNSLIYFTMVSHLTLATALVGTPKRLKCYKLDN